MIASCDKESNGDSNKSQGDCTPVPTTSLIDQDRQVLFEEFVGVSSVLSPTGSEQLVALREIYGDALITISYHAGAFATPLDQSVYNFRTEDADSVMNFVGEPIAYPSAVVNRKLFDGADGLQLFSNQWQQSIEEELAKSPSVKIGIEKVFDNENRNLEIQVTLIVDEDLTSQDIRLHVALLEDGLVDYQLTPAGLVNDYVHNHVLRDMVTSIVGDPLIVSPELDAAFCQTTEISISEDWVVENCKIIAFVSKSGVQKEVLQTQMSKVL